MKHIGENRMQEIKKETHVRFQFVMNIVLNETNFNIIIELLDLWRWDRQMSRNVGTELPFYAA